MSLASDRGNYSDWVEVREAADNAYRRIVAGRHSEKLLTALLAAFHHRITTVRPAIARCLGRIDDPRARAALYAELRRASAPTASHDSCLAAIAEQISHAPSAPLRTLRRWQALWAAQPSGGTTERVAADLVALSVGDGADELVTLGAFEVHAGATDPLAVTVAVLPASTAPVSTYATALVRPDDVAAVGLGREPKFRVCALSSPSPDHLHLDLAQTTWTESASFHRALGRLEDQAAEFLDRALTDLLTGRAYLPGIVAVHGIVLTQDGMVAQSRRSESSTYAPGAWSVSFEEQLTAVDLVSTTGSPVEAATRRGLVEEFQLPATAGRVSVLAAILQPDLIAPCIVVLYETEKTAEAIRSTAHAGHDEIDEIRFVAARPDALRTEAQRQDLHPTSPIRLHLLARILERTDLFDHIRPGPTAP